MIETLRKTPLSLLLATISLETPGIDFLGNAKNSLTFCWPRLNKQVSFSVLGKFSPKIKELGFQLWSLSQQLWWAPFKFGRYYLFSWRFLYSKEGHWHCTFLLDLVILFYFILFYYYYFLDLVILITVCIAEWAKCLRSVIDSLSYPSIFRQNKIIIYRELSLYY